MKKLLKEIDALKKEIDSHRPLSDLKRRQIRDYYQIGLTYTSNALEGNTLTESETKIVLHEGITIHGKSLKDHLEAVGARDSYDYMWNMVSGKSFSAQTLLTLHELFYYRIDPRYAGVYRDIEVYIAGSKYPLPAPEDVPNLMDEFIHVAAKKRKELHPVHFAAWAHKEFVFIHPFIDGNGRVARLLMNLVLLQLGYTITIIPPVVRPDYISTLERAHIDDGPFNEFIARMVRETQQDYLRLFG